VRDKWKSPGRTPVEFHQQIHIAGGCRFVSDYGPEQRQGRDAELARELRAVVSDDLEHLAAIHDVLGHGAEILPSAPN
jgi:hypothetical protein